MHLLVDASCLRVREIGILGRPIILHNQPVNHFSEVRYSERLFIPIAVNYLQSAVGKRSD
jgi:hypothetical protein